MIGKTICLLTSNSLGQYELKAVFTSMRRLKKFLKRYKAHVKYNVWILQNNSDIVTTSFSGITNITDVGRI